MSSGKSQFKGRPRFTPDNHKGPFLLNRAGPHDLFVDSHIHNFVYKYVSESSSILGILLRFFLEALNHDVVGHDIKQCCMLLENCGRMRR